MTIKQSKDLDPNNHEIIEDATYSLTHDIDIGAKDVASENVNVEEWYVIYERQTSEVM